MALKLIGKRILIRDLRYSDLDAYYEYGKNPNVGSFAGWKPFPDKNIASRVLSGQIISKETFALVLIETGQFVGTISLYNTGIRKYNRVKSLGFSMNSAYWGLGLMPEAVQLMLAYAFEKTDCELVEAGHHTDNYRCKRVLEKCGFNYDGTLCFYKKLYDGRIVDASFYSMTKQEYERKKNYE